MKKKAGFIAAFTAAFAGGFFATKLGNNDQTNTTEVVEVKDTTVLNIDNKLTDTIMTDSNLKLGAFSISLSVKDLKISKDFYEKLGFKEHGGNMEMGYLIMKNENALIGLFQGMFESNILTFNPGWNEMAEDIESFDDVRAIQDSLKKKEVELITEAPDSTTGPASLTLSDPDGNIILIDQHR